jgi:bleomycin hydrolase
VKTLIGLVLAITFIVQPALAQDRHDRAVFEVKSDPMIDSIRAESKKSSLPEPKKKSMLLDFSTIPAPASVDEFTRVWHSPPVLQGLSGMCWCFSTTSMMESEIYRLTHREIKLSELHTVYWEYVEKTRSFVQTRGKTFIGEGSESNAVFRIWKKYGVVPAQAYTGLRDGQKFHDHENTLFPEIKSYLAGVKARDAWNEEEVVATVRAILDHYIGPPPATVVVEGKNLTPKEFLRDVVRLNPDDYVDIMSLMEKPYYQQTEYEVQDNWWHSKEYYNIPLSDFMDLIKRAIRSGNSVVLGGDVSEAGYSWGPAGIAVVPSFDVPSSAIDEAARQFRFSNGTTGDDHGVHIVGVTERDGKDWYLVKDSWSSSRNNGHPGYYFYHEDYVKLKMIGVTVHRDIAREILARCTH